MSDPLDELRQLVTELAMISHAPISAYGSRTIRDSTESIGGKRPPGTDREYAPRRPRIPSEDASPQEWDAWTRKMDEWRDEKDAWEQSYHRRTTDYFLEQIARLVREAKETLEAWKRTPVPKGQDPQPGDPQWKRWVAESPESDAELARRFWNPRTGRQYTREYIRQVRKQYRSNAA